MDSRSYPIQDGGDFRCGTTPQKEQILIGPRGDYILAIFFDSVGNYLRHETRPRPAPPFRREDIDDPDVDFWPARKYLRDFRITPGTIHVKRFELPELRVALRDLPWIYKDFLDSGGHLFKYEDEDKHTQEGIEEWIERNQFVILWSKDYWMTGYGEVESC